MKKKLDARKTVFYIITLNVILIITMLAAFIYTMWTSDIQILSEEILLFYVLLAFVTISAVLTVATVFPMLRLIDERHSIGTILAETEKLNRTLRAQRHDFLNQLQVVYGLMELGDYDAANAYIEKVYDDIQKVSNILKTDHAALNAILQAKVGMCKTRDIDIRMEVNSRFTDITMPVWQLCRVFGNIIDNAVTALSDCEIQNKCIVISLSETVKGYTFRISNNGPPIPDAHWTQIFEPGFTTKEEEGHGMGLSICCELMEAYGGKLTVQSSTAETVFEGSLPRAAEII